MRVEGRTGIPRGLPGSEGTIRLHAFYFTTTIATLVSLVSLVSTTEGTPPRLRFVDVAAEAGVVFRHQNGATDQKMLPETYGSGVAFLDLEGDGDLDLYLVNGGALVAERGAVVNGVFRNDGAGAVPRFRDVGTEAQAPGTGYGMGALAGDYDGDGDTDLYTTQLGPDCLYANAGDGSFSDVTAAAGLGVDTWGTSATYLDADLDGDLDLFVVDYVQFAVDRNPWCGRRDLDLRLYCDPSEYEPTADRLYRNEGGGPVTRFTEVGAESGITGKGNGLGVLAADFDGDGDTDLYVANDMTPNFLYHNDGTGRFAEGGLMFGAALSGDGAPQAGMGVDVGDYDDDGDPDLLVTNYQLEHNTLYRNDGTWWEDVSFAAGLGQRSLNHLGFGTGFFDVDNDGALDIFVTNGHVHDNIEAFDPIVTHAQQPLLYRNVGGYFVDVSDAAGPAFAVPYVGRGSAFGDYDGDGDVDIAINNNGSVASLLRNDSAVGHWLRIVPLVGDAAPIAVGARVRVTAGGRTMTRWLRAGSGYQSTSEPAVHVGLGEETVAARVEVRWPGGATLVRTDVPAGRELRLRPPDSP